MISRAKGREREREKSKISSEEKKTSAAAERVFRVLNKCQPVTDFEVEEVLNHSDHPLLSCCVPGLVHWFELSTRTPALRRPAGDSPKSDYGFLCTPALSHTACFRIKAIIYGRND